MQGSVPNRPSPGARCARATVGARARAAAERWLAAALPPLLPRAPVILAYHNVVPRGEAPAGERALHLPRDAFAAHLDALARTHDVVPLADLLRPPLRPGARPRAAITFDDAYRGAVTAGVEELAARGLPATFFVVPGAVEGEAFWWDALAADGALPPGFRDAALEEARGEAGPVHALARERGMAPSPVPGHARPAGEAELRAAARVAGITFGAHGWTHASLARLEGAALEDELRRPLEWLRARLPAAAVPWLAYPYGLASPTAMEGAARAGYAGALRAAGGPLRPGAEHPFALPRVGVPAGLTPAGLALRAAGVVRR